MTILFKVEGFTRKIYKVTGSQDDDFCGMTVLWKTFPPQVSLWEIHENTPNKSVAASFERKTSLTRYLWEVPRKHPKQVSCGCFDEKHPSKLTQIGLGPGLRGHRPKRCGESLTHAMPRCWIVWALLHSWREVLEWRLVELIVCRKRTNRRWRYAI